MAKKQVEQVALQRRDIYMMNNNVPVSDGKEKSINFNIDNLTRFEGE